MSRRWIHYGALLAVIALTLLFFYQLAFTDKILGRGDTFAYFYPYWGARNQALAQGQLPLWSPDLFMGIPLLANPQLGTFYPPNWLTIPLNAPDAVRVSLLLHVAWAILGAYALAHQSLSLNRIPALLAGGLFGLGGFMSAHVEQINQLQGLAWMPWLFLLFHLALRQPRRYILPLALGFTLQVFTGHTQTVFITGLGLGVYGLVEVGLNREHRAELLVGLHRPVWILLAAGIVALLLALPQIIPTAELTGLSNRGGGLLPNEATAFSWNPMVIGRGLLPSYDGQLFGEYVAYLGVIGLGLALTGVLLKGKRQGRFTWLIIALLGLVLALGMYNPLYWALASLPGFNLFRVPARWLALFGLGAALLAGLGVQTLADYPAPLPRRVLIVIILVMLGLMGASLLMQFAPPEDMNGPVVPTLPTFAGWIVALLILLAILSRANLRRKPLLLTTVALLELFLASQILPFNDLVPPDVYNVRRFTGNQMQVYAEKQTPPGRFLSISNRFFDPGDKATLEARYRREGLGDRAVRHALVGIKNQETLFPNLPLTWDIPSVDGFGGGLLPTLYYTQFTSLLLPEDVPRTIDGRLGELLSREECRGACIPALRWLNAMNTEYLITDKVFDVVQDGIFYDTTFAVPGGQAQEWWSQPYFEANRVAVLFTGKSAPDVMVHLAGTTESIPLAGAAAEVTSLQDVQLAYYDLDTPTTPLVVELDVESDGVIYGGTLVDRRTGDFQQLMPVEWERVLSSDVKIYRYSRDLLPRAYVVTDLLVQPDDWAGSEAALQDMAASDFNPFTTAVLHGDMFVLPQVLEGRFSPAAVTHYEATQVEVEVHSEAAGFLLLTDAYYPGWKATVNGEPVDIYRANVMFRAVPVPEGDSVVTFTYQPDWLPAIFWVGGVIWCVTLALAGWLWLRRKIA